MDDIPTLRRILKIEHARLLYFRKRALHGAAAG
jgi:hypothetical protein